MLPVINIGPAAIPTAPLLALLGFWIGLELAERHAPRFNADPSRFYHLVMVGILAGITGARLGYLLRAPAAFATSPLAIFSPRPEMLDPLAGWMVALLATAAYALWKRIPLAPALDSAATLFGVLAVALGLSHLASGSAFGIETGVPWAIRLWGADRHPTQIYETLAALAILGAVWPGGALSRVSGFAARPGLRFWIFLALSALARILLETFRADSTLLWNAFRQAQVLAWLALAVSLWQIGKTIRQPASAAPVGSRAD